MDCFSGPTRSVRATPGEPLRRKILVVGDGASGKTSLLRVAVNGSFPTVYEPTIFESLVLPFVLPPEGGKGEGIPLELQLVDTAGQEDFDRLRGLSYSDTHVILVCFSAGEPDSLSNVEEKWIPEINEKCPGVKSCLVALKCDLRSDPSTLTSLAKQGAEPVPYEDGLQMAKRMRMSRYLECSAKEDRGVKEVFEEAARVSVGAKVKGESRGSRKESRGCTIS